MNSPRAIPTDALPKNLGRPERLALFAMQLNCDEETGEVTRGVSEDGETETAYQRIARWCGWEGRSAASDAVTALVEHRLVARVGSGKDQRIFVLCLGSARSREQETACKMCPRDAAGLKGSDVCAACRQIERRLWKGEALEIWRKCKRLGFSDEKIAYTVHARLKRPLWGKAEEGVKGSGSGDGEGVIPALVALGVFPRDMLRNAERARAGEDGEE